MQFQLFLVQSLFSLTETNNFVLLLIICIGELPTTAIQYEREGEPHGQPNG